MAALLQERLQVHKTTYLPNMPCERPLRPTPDWEYTLVCSWYC